MNEQVLKTNDANGHRCNGPTACCDNASSKVTSTPKAAFKPAFDAWRENDKIVLQGDLPGATSGGLTLQFEDGVLKLVAKVEHRGNGSRLSQAEYGVGDYRRSFRLKQDIDAERISAKLDQGVLTIEMPIAEKAKPRKIEVSAS